MSSDANRLSWRDPDGFVLRVDGRILRAVVPERVPDLDRLIKSDWFQARTRSGCLTATRWLPEAPVEVSGHNRYAWLEQDVLNFPCYPHEITALQLHDAAKLTLSLCTEALNDGWTLKDASAWNVLFEHGKPVFCDVLSFTAIDDTGIWMPYAQFCRHFLIPLLLHKALGIEPASLFLVHRDGIPPQQARQMLKGLSAWWQPALEAVTLPALLARLGRATVDAHARARPRERDAELAQFLIRRTLSRLGRHIDSLQPDPNGRHTRWANYKEERRHYTDDDLLAKQDFVRNALAQSPAVSILDLGCNAGEFSLIAAALGKSVVAADVDSGALTRLYSRIRRKPEKISPVLLDVGRPTPAVGWMNEEVPAFIQRAQGRFDCILMLGLIHHLFVTDRVPLPLIGSLMRWLKPRSVLIEWIEPQDPQFAQLAGLNQALYAGVDHVQFEAAFRDAYRLVTRKRLACGTRVLYHWDSTAVPDQERGTSNPLSSATNPAADALRK